MDGQELIVNNDVTKKAGSYILVQLVMMTVALMISLAGVFSALDIANEWNRLVVYGGQAAICLATIVFGVSCFNKKDTKHFRSLVLAYALVEAIRVSLLQTGNIPGMYSYSAKFVLALVVLSAALLSEKFEKKEGFCLSLAMVCLELLLFVIFIIGFPAVRTQLLYMVLPLAGIFMTGAMCVFVRGRSKEISANENNTPT